MARAWLVKKFARGEKKLEERAFMTAMAVEKVSVN